MQPVSAVQAVEGLRLPGMRPRCCAGRRAPGRLARRRRARRSGRSVRPTSLAFALLEDRLTWTSADPLLLPARREEIELRTLDELTLVGELALPRDREPVATLVTLHPLPTAGGFMDSHILRKSAARLPALADLAVLRFNTRGTTSPRGTSEGAFDGGGAEAFDLAAAMDFVRERRLPHPWLVGLVVRHRGRAEVRTRPRRRRRDPALAAPAPHDARRGRRVGGRLAQGRRRRAGVRRLPPAGCRRRALRERSGCGHDHRRGRQAPVGRREPDPPRADRDRRGASIPTRCRCRPSGTGPSARSPDPVISRSGAG